MEEDFKLEEVDVESDISTNEHDEDLENALNSARKAMEGIFLIFYLLIFKARASSADVSTSASRTSNGRVPEIVEDFFRNYLFRHGFHSTLDCFEVFEE